MPFDTEPELLRLTRLVVASLQMVVLLDFFRSNCNRKAFDDSDIDGSDIDDEENHEKLCARLDASF